MVPPVAPRPAPPDDVRTACQLWYAALAVGVVQVVAGLLSQLGRRRELAQQMFDEMKDSQPTITLAQVEMWVPIVFGLVGFFWLILTGVGAAIVYQLGRGKNWARALLTGLALFFVLGAVGTFFMGGDEAPGAASLVASCAGIVQGVLAAGAVFLCFRKDSDAYFRPVAR
ncbi:hypothetical protein JK358_14980 [Nocardia sp. 2]|uniref:Integral membrane protein n=1 Tax=Nocardia acididurans TaxID=2802282 RepID=A0ABS1M4X1_9NOCA|nr:hypothetical protein [Nocardia acididurans]MBL1075697.1 hypothetical protein [Nocardia acididurans]